MSGRAGIACRPPRQFDVVRLSALEACSRAAECVKKAGLDHCWTSTKSEACYYRMTGRHGVLRIATHSKRSQNASLPDGPAIVSVTFPEGNLKGFPPEYVENHIANGIGLYLIRAARK